MNNKPVKVLSLFNGMSVAHMAFESAGFKDVEVYYSEVDKHANNLTEYLFPEDQPLGDVRGVNALSIPDGWVDYLVGGSPCQSFSFAGKRNGMTTTTKTEILTLTDYKKCLDEGIEFEGYSYLFWEFVRVLEDVRVLNPNVKFLLENVNMSKKWEDVISNTLGVKPLHICSSSLTAHNRKRLYWTNIEGVSTPTYKEGNTLRSVYEEGCQGNLTPGRFKWLTTAGGVQSIKKAYTSIRPLSGKAACLTARADSSWNANYFLFKSEVRLEDTIVEGIDNLVREGIITEGLLQDYFGEGYEVLKGFVGVRKFTINETLTLQSISDVYKDKITSRKVVSDSQVYKMLGNGWTEKVITHIVSFDK